MNAQSVAVVEVVPGYRLYALAGREWLRVKVCRPVCLFKTMWRRSAVLLYLIWFEQLKSTLGSTTQRIPHFLDVPTAGSKAVMHLFQMINFDLIYRLFHASIALFPCLVYSIMDFVSCYS